MRRREFLAAAASLAAAPVAGRLNAAAERRFIYAATPGIRNYLEYGGIGVLVFDVAAGHKFVKRIPTWRLESGQEADNVKGIAAHAGTSRLFVSTIKRLAAFDLGTDRKVWDREIPGGCDRLSVSPDGSTLYVPSFEGPHWTVVRAATGETITTIILNSGAHNTLYSRDGTRVYLAGLHSPVLSVADAHTHTVVSTVGPFTREVRPFTINGAQTLCYVNVNDLLGFEVGDIKTGRKLHRVVVQGYEQGPVLLHGCPSHGVGLTPDERELWLADGHNKAVHIFDNTVLPPRQVSTLKLRDQPGWITFSINGEYAYPSSGEVFEVRSKRLVATLEDEEGRHVGSEKLLEVVFDGAKPVRAGDQFGMGLAQRPK
jgi:hypothetical protein